MDPYSETFLKHFGVKSTRSDLRENRARLTKAKARKRADLSRRIEHMQSLGTDTNYQEVLSDFQLEAEDFTDTTLVAKKYKPKLDRALAEDLKFDDYDEGVEVLKEVRLDHVVHNGIPELLTGNFESTSFVSNKKYSKDNRRPVPNLDETPDDELFHYGVTGMKWGIRRGRSALSTASSNAKGNLKRMSGNRAKRHKLVKDVAAKAGDNAKGNIKRMSGNRAKRHALAKDVADKAGDNAKGNLKRMAGNRDRRHDVIKKLVGKPGSKRYKALEKTAEEAVTNKIKKRVVSDTKAMARERGKYLVNQAKHPLLYGKAVAKHAAKNPSSLIVLTGNDIKAINKAIDADVASKKRK